MVNFRRLTDQAKKIVDKRGGTDALSSSAQQGELLGELPVTRDLTRVHDGREEVPGRPGS
jgi:hypothetical protein